jgi:voltage-gated sodium channel
MRKSLPPVQSSRGVFPHVMDEVLPQMPAAWIYFVSFILIATFVAMNFFVGVIVNNLQAVEIEERDDIAEIRKALARVEAQLQSSRDAEASEERSESDQRHLERAS